MVVKLKKLALNHRGIPKPPDLGYTVTYPIPSMEEMEKVAKIEEENRRSVMIQKKEQKEIEKR